MAKRVMVNPSVCSGKPFLEGTRIPVHMVLDLLVDGATIENVLADYYPQLAPEDVLECIRYANALVKAEEVVIAEGRAAG
jgi:uncharacterized protein (DUF433 family)